jgi:hypothetical protein
MELKLPATLVSKSGRHKVVAETFEHANNLMLTHGYSVVEEEPDEAQLELPDAPAEVPAEAPKPVESKPARAKSKADDEKATQ